MRVYFYPKIKNARLDRVEAVFSPLLGRVHDGDFETYHGHNEHGEEQRGQKREENTHHGSLS